MFTLAPAETNFMDHRAEISNIYDGTKNTANSISRFQIQALADGGELPKLLRPLSARPGLSDIYPSGNDTFLERQNASVGLHRIQTE